MSLRAELGVIPSSSILNALSIKEVRDSRQGIERSPFSVISASCAHTNDSSCDREG